MGMEASEWTVGCNHNGHVCCVLLFVATVRPTVLLRGVHVESTVCNAPHAVVTVAEHPARMVSICVT